MTFAYIVRKNMMHYLKKLSVHIHNIINNENCLGLFLFFSHINLNIFQYCFIYFDIISFLSDTYLILK